jgi:hypothetical protein
MDGDVRQMFRTAVAHSDAEVMRPAIERLFAHGDAAALSAEAEYELRDEAYVMEMPQSGERIRSRDDMRSMQEAFPNPPAITLRRVAGAGRVWVIEGVNDYGDGDTWHVVLVLEFTEDGRILRDTRYYAKPFDPPDWRAAWVERM